MPTYLMVLASRKSENQLDIGDMAFSGAMIGFVALSFVSDQQQWSKCTRRSIISNIDDRLLLDFQNAKHDYLKSAKNRSQYHQEDLDRGFNVVGLWSLSRHPNFAAEQSVWVTLYAWSCYVTKTYYNWTGIGAVAYLILFQASTWFTELVSARKYPEYEEYQKRVGKFVPRLSSKLPGNFSDQYGKKKESKQQ